MFKYSVILFFILLSGISHAQDQQDITRDYNSYTKALKDKNWQYILDHTYPGLFEYIPRAQMEQLYNSMDNEVMQIEFGRIEALHISDTYHYGNDKFAEVKYRAEILVSLKGNRWNDELIQNTITMLKQQFGEASYDEMSRTILFVGEKELMAINNSKTNGFWNFLELSKAEMQQMSKVIPEDVLNHFKQ
jgi:hypothetical protein